MKKIAYTERNINSLNIYFDKMIDGLKRYGTVLREMLSDDDIKKIAVYHYTEYDMDVEKTVLRVDDGIVFDPVTLTLRSGDFEVFAINITHIVSFDSENLSRQSSGKVTLRTAEETYHCTSGRLGTYDGVLEAFSNSLGMSVSKA